MQSKLTPPPSTPALVRAPLYAIGAALALTASACSPVTGPAPTCGPCCHTPQLCDAGGQTDVPSTPADVVPNQDAGAD